MERQIAEGKTPTQLELLGDYIVRGRGPEESPSAIDAKEVLAPPSRYSTFTRKEPVSLDGLNELPSFNEASVKAIERNTYTKPKRTITRPIYAIDAEGDYASSPLICLNERTHDANVPGMVDLWRAIDYLTWLSGKQEWSRAIVSPQKYRVRLPQGMVSVRKILRPVIDVNGELRPQLESPPTPPKLSSLDHYRLRHWLIDLKQRQFALKESDSPTAFAQHFSFTTPGTVDWEENSGHWLTRTEARNTRRTIAPDALWRWRPATRFTYEQAGAQEVGHCSLSAYHQIALGGPTAGKDFREKLVRDTLGALVTSGPAPADLLSTSMVFVREYYFLVAEHTIDLTNPLHIYALLENYRDLRIATHDKLTSQLRHILNALSEIVDKTELHESREIILYYKVHKWTNERILRELNEFGYSYAVNYISTIWKKEICTKIAKQAAAMEQQWLARNNPSAWRTCSACGKRKLATNDNFINNPKNYLGLSMRCKACDKVDRERRKNG